MPGQVVIAEPAAGASVPLWRFEYTKLDGTALAEITGVRSRRLTFNLNAPQTVEFTMNLRDPATDDLLLNPDGMIFCYKRERLVMVAEVSTIQIVGEANERSIRVVGTELPWVRLGKRLDGQNVNGVFFEDIDRSSMIMESLDRLNTINDTGVRVGGIQPSSVATAGPFYFKQFTELLSELGNPLNGFDYWFDPGFPQDQEFGSRGFLFVSPFRGSIRDDVVFEFGTGRSNLRSYEFQIDNQQRITRALSLPPAFPDNLGLDVKVSPQENYATLINSQSPNLYWRLGEIDPNNSTAASGSTDPASPTGTYSAGMPRPVAGALIQDVDKAQEFLGGADRVTSTFDPFQPGDDVTVSCWAKSEFWNFSSRALWGVDGATKRNLLEIPGSTYDLRLFIGTTSFTFQDVVPQETGEWFHVAVVVEPDPVGGNGNAFLYINGGPRATIGIGSTDWPAAVTNFQAGNTGQTNSWDALLDEVAIWERSLTPSEVLDQANQAVATGAPAELGVREEIIESELADENLRQALVDEHVNVRAAGRNVFLFQPHINDDTGRVPSFLEDYNIGDVIRGRVNDEDQVVLDGLVRVYGATIELDDEGTERVDLTIVNEGV